MRALLLVAWCLAIVAPGHASAATPRYVAAGAHIDHYELPADQLTRAAELVHAAHVDYVVRELWGLIVLVVVMRLGIAAAVARWVERRTARRWLQTLVVTSVVLTIVAIAKLPLALVLDGLASATAWSMQTGFTVVVGTLVASALYAIIRRFPRGWWWRAWLFALPLVVVAPIAATEVERVPGVSRLIDRDPKLVDRIEVLAERRGVAVDRDRIFVVSSAWPDAQAAGIGPWRAIFVDEGALAELNDRELGFLFAHELGHFSGPAVEAATVAVLALMLAVVLAALAAMVGAAVRWRGTRWGVSALASPASLPVGLLAIGLLGIAVTPIRAVVQRRIEHQADANGLQLLATTHPDARQAAAHELQRMGEIFGAPPHDGMLDLVCGIDHPAIGDRIAFVLAARGVNDAIGQRGE